MDNGLAISALMARFVSGGGDIVVCFCYLSYFLFKFFCVTRQHGTCYVCTPCWLQTQIPPASASQMLD